MARFLGRVFGWIVAWRSFIFLSSVRIALGYARVFRWTVSVGGIHGVSSSEQETNANRKPSEKEGKETDAGAERQSSPNGWVQWQRRAFRKRKGA